MPHKIFEIDEILRVIIRYTGDISVATTASLACCCKSFEEPALGLLWARKPCSTSLPSFQSRFSCMIPLTRSGNDSDDTHPG